MDCHKKKSDVNNFDHDIYVRMFAMNHKKNSMWANTNWVNMCGLSNQVYPTIFQVTINGSVTCKHWVVWLCWVNSRCSRSTHIYTPLEKLNKLLLTSFLNHVGSKVNTFYDSSYISPTLLTFTYGNTQNTFPFGYIFPFHDIPLCKYVYVIYTLNKFDHT